MDELIDDGDLVGFTDAPNEKESATLAEMGQELMKLEQSIVWHEHELKKANRRKNELVFDEMPKYMLNIGQDKIGLEEYQVDLVSEPYYHANIKADWPEEQRQRAFDYLDARGDGDLIKSQVAISAGRGDWEKMKKLIAVLDEILAEEQIKGEVTSKLDVPWNTLTAFVKEQVKKGKPIDLEVLGATVGRVVKIKQRKSK